MSNFRYSIALENSLKQKARQSFTVPSRKRNQGLEAFLISHNTSLNKAAPLRKRVEAEPSGSTGITTLSDLKRPPESGSVWTSLRSTTNICLCAPSRTCTAATEMLGLTVDLCQGFCSLTKGQGSRLCPSPSQKVAPLSREGPFRIHHEAD